MQINFSPQMVKP